MEKAPKITELLNNFSESSWSLFLWSVFRWLFVSVFEVFLFPSLQPQVEVLSEEEGEEEDEEEDILSLAEEKYRPAALEKMIALIALLVEQSRSERYQQQPLCDECTMEKKMSPKSVLLCFI